jgi:hypothetical protein
MDRNNK